MSRSILEYLDHILEETDFLLKEADKLQFDDFIKDDVLMRAFVRSLEIIGEATKNVPQEFRDKYPDVEWKKWQGCGTNSYMVISELTIKLCGQFYSKRFHRSINKLKSLFRISKNS